MSQAGQAGSTPPGGGPVNDITGDTGATVSGHVKLYARTGSANSGSTVRFNGVSATEMDLQVTDTLTSNTFIGQSAGNATVTGNANTGFGAFALGSLTDGVANVTVGSLYNLTSGSNNVAVGSSSLSNCSTGDSNVALGTSSLAGNIAGQGNVGVGFNTGVQITGSFNTALGYTSLENCHGSYNTAVGNNSGHNYTSTEASNVLLANAGVIAESNVMRLGTQGSGVGQVNTAYAAGIVGNTVSNAQLVTIDSSTGQLGVTSSTTYLTTGILVTTFDASGTWTKSTNPPTKLVDVYIFGGGGGGGSGRRATSTTSGGGSGGSGGGGYFFSAPATFFDTSETITIGATSNGGAAQSADNTNGNPGAAPNQSTFANVGQTVAGTSKGGTTGTIGVSGQPRSGAYTYLSGAILFANAGNGSQQVGSTPAAPTANQVSYLSGTGGGGGSGYDTVTVRTAGAGGSLYRFNGSTVILAGGTAGIETGTIDGGNGNPPPSTGGLIMGGSGGGGGGGPSAGTTAGKGGNGAIPGGGGGGGGGGINGTANSGAGGTGAQGRIIVIEHF